MTAGSKRQSASPTPFIPETSSIEGKRAMIIGGSSGVGRALAEKLSVLGAGLVLVGRDADKLAGVADRLDGVVIAVARDAHEAGAAEELLTEVGEVDHLVSMVGDSMSGGFLDTPPETVRHVLHSKLLTNWEIARAAAPRIGEGGSITFTSGTGGRPHEVSATYVANLGIAALVQGLAVELAPRARVNAVAPTFMGHGTSFWRAVPDGELDGIEDDFVAAVPLGRLATAEEVATAYLHLIANPYVTGQVIAVDGGVMLGK
jgi:NAD(P)-dependent dehydrogenase (short-subunit alcohol dehydrogenase family)